MGGGVAGAPFQLQRDADQMGDARIGVHFRLQFGHAGQGPLQIPRVGGVGRNELRQPVDLPIGQLQNPSHVLDHRARLQGPEGDDLGHLGPAIFPLHIADHFLAPGFAEIDVEIGH